jgi:hypothetical protein
MGVSVTDIHVSGAINWNIPYCCGNLGCSLDRQGKAATEYGITYKKI